MDVCLNDERSHPDEHWYGGCGALPINNGNHYQWFNHIETLSHLNGAGQVWPHDISNQIMLFVIDNGDVGLTKTDQ